MSLDPKGKGQPCFHDWPLFNAGNDLLSHTLSRATGAGVQSALRGYDHERCELTLLPFVQVDTASSRLAWRVDSEERLDAFSFTANGEGIEKLVPALGRFFRVWSLRFSFEPSA